MIARLYRVRYYTVRAEMKRQGIPLHSRKGVKKSAAWYAKSRQHWDDPEWRDEQRRKWLERLPTMNGKAANSPLERLLQAALIKAGISFSTQRALLGRYVVDILIAQAPVVVEADGNTHLQRQAEDSQRDAALAEAGYRVFRFTGKPICNDPDGCVAQVIEACGLTPDADARADIRGGRTGPDNNKWKGGKPQWTCAVCGKVFRAYLRNRRPRTTCSRECQATWQTRVRIKRRSNSVRMRELWSDPVWRANTIASQRAARWPATDGDTVRPHVRA